MAADRDAPRRFQDVILELLKQAMLDQLQGSYGFLIDGFPRDEEQAVAFEKEVSGGICRSWSVQVMSHVTMA